MTSNTVRGSLCDQFSPPEGAQSYSDDPPVGQMESFSRYSYHVRVIERQQPLK